MLPAREQPLPDLEPWSRAGELRQQRQRRTQGRGREHEAAHCRAVVALSYEDHNAGVLREDSSPRSQAIGVALVALLGGLAAALTSLGNPGNMGLCGVCFLRDWAGALALHGGPAIFRPEVAGIAFGALAWSAASRRHIGRSGSYAAARFMLGVTMSFGALVFLGCPFRMLQRLGGGDLHAWAALPGFVGGVAAATYFERRGYSLGKTQPVPLPVGLVGVGVLCALLGIFLFGDVLAGPGPGSTAAPAHALWWQALGIALIAGGILSATGFCAVSAARQVFGPRRRMLVAAAVFVAAYAVVVGVDGRFKLTLEGQPVSHADWLWSALAMALVGLSGALAGGCPVRQLVLAGEGNGDAFVAVGGMVLGGALAHSLGLASAPATGELLGGVTPAGRVSVVACLIVVVVYAAAMSRAQPRAAIPHAGSTPPM